METNTMNRLDLYELCVQSTGHLVPLLRALHGHSPCVLGEDFAGTAALSHSWVKAIKDASAIAVDLDEQALAHHDEHASIARRAADVRTVSDPVDVLFVGNFSIGYLHTRAELVSYLRHARERLTTGGVFVCDTYGGENAYTLGHVHRHHILPDGRRVRYTWEQREADPLTARVVDVLHFRIERGGVIEDELMDAFVYDWRLWSVPELRDAMAEAGFDRSDVYQKLPDAEDDEGNLYLDPVTNPEDLEDSFIVLVSGRAGS